MLAPCSAFQGITGRFDRPFGRASLEQNPSDLNREGFPTGANSDSPWVLDREASTHGQAFVGGFADQGSPSG